MKQINKKIKFIIKNILKVILGFILYILIPKNKNLFVLGGREAKTFNNIREKKEIFIDNTKALFLYLNNIQTDMKVVYLCDDKNMVKEFKKKELKNIYSRNSLQGLWSILSAKYWLCDHGYWNITDTFYPFGVKVINLWHGVPLKKIAKDENRNRLKSVPVWEEYIKKLMTKQNDKYVINSEYEKQCYKTGFEDKESKFEIIGSPRLDSVLHELQKADIFMEESFKYIQQLKQQNKNIFIYMPTFRDSEKDISGWLKSKTLHNFLSNTNSILICKLHPLDINTLNFKLSNNFYRMPNISDVYPILKYTDALITDYSSVYFDYLLLDKPILYYPIDLEEYESTRGFYRPYEELTAGVKAYNEDELISAMQDVINGVDNYKEQRKMLRDKMFKYQDGKNCERVVEWIRSLDE